MNAQTVDLYSFSTSAGGTLDPMSGAATLIVSNQDDAASAVTNIGFAFNYEGISYSQFSVNSNGAMRLGSTVVTEYGIDNIADANYNPKIGPFVADGTTTTSGNVTTVLTGTAPNQIRRIQWNTGVDYNATSPNSLFQVWLYEGSNVIEFRYGSGSPTGSSSYWWTGISGAVGSNFINVRPGFVGSTTDVTRLQAWPGSGTIFTFTPPAPCSSPAPGNTVASATSGCPGMSTSLSLGANTPGSGVSYQWQSSADGSTWSSISGAISSIHTSGSLPSTTWFQCLVTCSTGPSTVASAPVQIVVSAPAPTYYTYTGAQFIEDFGGWANRCSTSDVPDGGSYWANTPAYGAGTWRRSNTTAIESGWDGIGQAGGTTGTAQGAHVNGVTVVQPAARFRNNFGTVAGTLDFHVDMSAGTGAELLRFEYINSGGSGTLEVLVSENGGGLFTSRGTLATTNTGGGAFNTWYTQQFTIGSASATTVIRLRGTPGAGNNLGVDNFRIIPVATCAAPTGPVATVTGPGAVVVSWTCASCTGAYYVEYGTAGFTLGTGTVVGPVTGTSASIIGVSNGSYQAYVRQDCGVNGISENAGPVSFNIVAGDFCANAIDLTTLPLTDWSTIANTAGAQNNYTSSGCFASMTGPDVVLYRDVEVGATIKFTLQGIGSKLTVAVGAACPGTTSLACTPNGGGYLELGTYVQEVDWDYVFSWTNNGCSTERLYILASGTTPSGGAVYIANYAYTPASGSFCATVSGIAANVTGLNTAGVSWNATCSGNVIVEYGPAGFTPGMGALANGGTAVAVTGTSMQLTGLIAGQSYDVHVRQDCGGAFSANSATSFTITPGENCAVAVDLANEVAPFVASTTAMNNDVPTVSCGASPGGDLVYFIAVPNGATIVFEALHDYNALVEVSYGSSCPGTVLTCAADLDAYTWINTTGQSQNVYWLQDGTNSGDFLLSWELQDPCAIDSDGDGVGDCLDLCPGGPEPGTPCDDGDPTTINDVITEDCICAGTPVAVTVVTVELRSDDGSEVSWEILNNGTSAVVCQGGGYSAAATLITENCNLPEGCYRLRMMDSGGDGFGTNGGYQLRLLGSNPTDIRIIDNLGNFTNMTPNGSLSAIGSGPAAFCLPMANGPKPMFHHQDRLDFTSGQYLVCEEDASVSAVWIANGANSVQSTTTGYEFWFFDPNGSYSYRRFRNHATSDNFGNVGATRTCHMKINNWVAAQHAPENMLLNVRIRSRVNGVNANWGPAYRFKIDPVRAACPLTQLNDTPDNVALSCNQTRAWGTGNWIHARPIAGANKYQFRFRIASENFNRVITTNTYFLQLNWATNPLLAGRTYDVDVRASKDGGATWCTAAVAPALTAEWGVMCTLTIGGNAQGGGQQLAEGIEGKGFDMYPNPNSGEQLWLTVNGIEKGVNQVSVDIYDMAGHRAVARLIPTQGEQLQTILELNGELAAGVYVVQIMAGDQRYTERLVIQH